MHKDISQKIKELVAAFKKVADDFYDPVTFQPKDLLQYYFNVTGDKLCFHSINDHKWKQELDEVGICEVAYFAEGSTATVYACKTKQFKEKPSQFCAMRISSDSKMNYYPRYDYPIMLQPYKKIEVNDAPPIELLPLVPVITNNQRSGYNTYNKALNENGHVIVDILRENKVLIELEDVGVLPNGTLIWVDPHLMVDFRNEGFSSNKLLTSIRGYPGLEEISWFDENGGPKQNHFFKSENIFPS